MRDGLKSLQSRLPSLEAAVGLSAIALVYMPFPSWQPDSHDQPVVSCLGAYPAHAEPTRAACSPLQVTHCCLLLLSMASPPHGLEPPQALRAAQVLTAVCCQTFSGVCSLCFSTSLLQHSPFKSRFLIYRVAGLLGLSAPPHQAMHCFLSASSASALDLKAVLMAEQCLTGRCATPAGLFECLTGRLSRNPGSSRAQPARRSPGHLRPVAPPGAHTAYGPAGPGSSQPRSAVCQKRRTAAAIHYAAGPSGEPPCLW